MASTAIQRSVSLEQIKQVSPLGVLFFCAMSPVADKSTVSEIRVVSGAIEAAHRAWHAESHGDSHGYKMLALSTYKTDAPLPNIAIEVSPVLETVATGQYSQHSPTRPVPTQDFASKLQSMEHAIDALSNASLASKRSMKALVEGIAKIEKYGDRPAFFYDEEDEMAVGVCVERKTRVGGFRFHAYCVGIICVASLKIGQDLLTEEYFDLAKASEFELHISKTLIPYAV